MTTHNAVHTLTGRTEDPRPGVLVVEDHVEAADAACGLVRRLGYRVTAASGMLDGLAVLRERQFALVLLDLEMSGMGAVEGLRRLRHPDQGHSFATPDDASAIAVTPADRMVDGERLRELGFDDHVARPLRASQVRLMLNKHLRHADTPTGALGMGATGDVHQADNARPVPVSEADTLDPAALAHLAELDPRGRSGLIERVFQAFQSSALRLRGEADGARLVNDEKVLLRVAHTLKSSSATIGAIRLSQLCAEIETSLLLKPGADLGSRFDEMNQRLDGVLRLIAGRVKEAP